MKVLVLALFMIGCVYCIPPDWLCTGEVPTYMDDKLASINQDECVIFAGPTPTMTVYRGYPVTVCVVATQPCICSAVEVNGVAILGQCLQSNRNGLQLANYSIDNVVENLNLHFAFYDVYTKSSSYVLSNMTRIVVKEVVVYNVTTSNGYHGVQLWWLSSPTDKYRVKVECDNSFHNLTTPYANVTLKLVDYWNNSVCSVYLSAATPVGWGPETNTTVCFYEDPMMSNISQDIVISLKVTYAEVMYSFHVNNTFCLAGLPTEVIISNDTDTVQNTSLLALYDPVFGGVNAAVIAKLPKHLPPTNITTSACNRLTCVNFTKELSTFEVTRFIYQACQDGGILFECTFANGSTSLGCIVVVAKQTEVRIERNGTSGSKIVMLSPGELEFSVYDWDNSGKFGPVFVKNVSYTSCDVDPTTSEPTLDPTASPSPTTGPGLHRIHLVLIIVAGVTFVLFLVIIVLAVFAICWYCNFLGELALCNNRFLLPCDYSQTKDQVDSFRPLQNGTTMETQEKFSKALTPEVVVIQETSVPTEPCSVDSTTGLLSAKGTLGKHTDRSQRDTAQPGTLLVTIDEPFAGGICDEASTAGHVGIPPSGQGGGSISVDVRGRLRPMSSIARLPASATNIPSCPRPGTIVLYHRINSDSDVGSVNMTPTSVASCMLSSPSSEPPVPDSIPLVVTGIENSPQTHHGSQ